MESSPRSRLSLRLVAVLCTLVLSVRLLSFDSRRPYAVYTMEVSVGGVTWVRQVRFSDFFGLRCKLREARAAAGVPRLPGRGWRRILTEEHLETKKAMLQRWIDDVLKDPSLRSAPDLARFLARDVPLADFERVRSNGDLDVDVRPVAGPVPAPEPIDESLRIKMIRAQHSAALQRSEETLAEARQAHRDTIVQRDRALDRVRVLTADMANLQGELAKWIEACQAYSMQLRIILGLPP